MEFFKSLRNRDLVRESMCMVGLIRKATQSRLKQTADTLRCGRETEIATCMKERMVGDKETIFEERKPRNFHNVMERYELSANKPH